MLVTLIETTGEVRAARRLATLHHLAAMLRDATDQEICLRLMRALATNPQDVPFALIYLDQRGPGASASTGLSGDRPDRAAWPAHGAVDDLATRFPGLVAGARPLHAAVILPVATGLLVLGVGAQVPLDAGYRQFFDLVAELAAAALDRATG